MAGAARQIAMTYGNSPVTAIAGGGVYTLTVFPWMIVGGQITIFGAANAGNNGTFTLTAVGGTTVTTNNPASVSEGAGAWAGFPVTGVSNFQQHDKHRIKNAYKETTYEWDMVYLGANDQPTFQTFVTQAQQAFRTPRQRFRLLFNGTVFEDLDPNPSASGNTGFWQDPEINKLGNDWDTSRSRGWHVRVTILRPADLPGQNGRQDSDIIVNYDPSNRRTITIRARYTALGINNARAQYLANIPSYAGAIKSYIAAGDGSVYETVGQNVSSDDPDKYCDATYVMEELIYDQSSVGRDDPAIVQGRYNYTREQIGPGDTDPGTVRLEIITIEFDTWIDKNVTQDLAGYWESPLKGYLLTQVQSKFSLSQMALVDHQRTLDYSLNRIKGHCTVHAVGPGGGGLIQSRYTTKLTTLTGKRFLPAWSGDPLAKHVYQGPARLIRTRVWTKLSVGSSSSGGGQQPNPASGSGGGGGAIQVGVGAGIGGFNQQISFNFANGFVQASYGSNYTGASQSQLALAAMSDGPALGGDNSGGGQAAPAGELAGAAGFITVSDTVTNTPLTIGLPNQGYSIDLIETERELIEEFANPPAGAGGGGGGGGGGTPTGGSSSSNQAAGG